MTNCPTCGQEVALVKGLELREATLFSTTGSLRLGAVPTAIVRVLMAGPLGTEELAERVYCGAPDAPAFPERSIQTTMVKLRQKLPTIGWTIVNVGSGRGGGSIYRLVKITLGKTTT